MIKQTFNHNLFLEICGKLKEVDNCRLSSNTLYAYMLSEYAFTYVSYDNEIMNGCLVLRLFNDNEGNISFLMLFIWVNAHYPKLLEEFVKLTDKKAKELDVKKIYFVANRKEEVIIRRVGKFGFKRAYITYCKEVG